jgi:hypothetical protein
MKPAAAIPAAVRPVAVAAAIVTGAAIDAAAIDATSINAGAVAVSAAIAETVTAAIAAIVAAAVVRRAVIAAVARVLTTGERSGEPRDDDAQKNPTPNHGSFPNARLNATCAPFVMETKLVGPPGRITRRPTDRLTPDLLRFIRMPGTMQTRRKNLRLIEAFL